MKNERRSERRSFERRSPNPCLHPKQVHTYEKYDINVQGLLDSIVLEEPCCIVQPLRHKDQLG